MCRQPGRQGWGTLGFPEAQLLTAITAYRVGGWWVAVGSGMGDTLWPVLHGSVQRPLAPLKRSQEEGASPGPRAWPCGSQTAQVCVPRVRYPFTLARVCSRCGKHVALYLVGTLQGKSGAFYLQGKQMLLPHLDCLSFPVKKRGFLQVRQEAAALARTVPSGGPSGPFTLRIYPLLPMDLLFCLCHISI